MNGSRRAFRRRGSCCCGLAGSDLVCWRHICLWLRLPSAELWQRRAPLLEAVTALIVLATAHIAYLLVAAQGEAIRGSTGRSFGSDDLPSRKRSQLSVSDML